MEVPASRESAPRKLVGACAMGASFGGRLKALCLVWIVAVAGSLAMSGGASAAESSSHLVSGGELDWGLKQSFRNYITGPIAHGTAVLSEGASQNEDGTYSFPVTSGEPDPVADQASIASAGKITFDGHGGQLHLEFENPRVVIAGTGGTLFADVTSRALGSEEVQEFPDVAFAELDLSTVTASVSEGEISWQAIPATLTADGSPAFAGFYGEGTVLDPVSLTVSLASLSSDPLQLAFDQQPLSTLSAARVVTLTGVGEDIAIDRLRTTGGASDDFIVTGDECTGTTLGGGESCQVRLRFSPSEQGSRQSELLVEGNGEAVLTIALSGSGGELPQGPVGLPGEDGASGERGATGPQGVPGPQGESGPEGARGARGSRGARGLRGEPGRDARVSCRVRGNGDAQRVVCRVQFRDGAAAAERRARLIRRGKVFAAGKGRRLVAKHRLKAGRYVLKLGRGARATNLRAVVR